MPAGADVRPEKWSGVVDLYDDGSYSAIWGRYEHSDTRSVGVRWNGADGHPGYPNQGPHATWYVEPDFMTESVLHRLLDLVIEDRTNGDLQAVLDALKEARTQT